MNALALKDEVESKIHRLPGHPPFMLGQEVASLYGTEPRYVVRAVQRNQDRFPADFAFRLTAEEVEILRCQNVTAISPMARVAPLAFTHEGCNALSGVLKSPIAAARSVQINRAFTAIERGEFALAQANALEPETIKLPLREWAEIQKERADLLAFKVSALESRRPVRRSLSDDEKQRIEQLLARGTSKGEIGRLLGRTEATICSYCRRHHRPLAQESGIIRAGGA
jgi:hypothetical protein